MRKIAVQAIALYKTIPLRPIKPMIILIISSETKPNPISTLHMRFQSTKLTGLEVEGYMLEHL